MVDELFAIFDTMLSQGKTVGILKDPGVPPGHEVADIPEWSGAVRKSKFYGAFVLNRPVDLHAIDATPARWRGDADFS